MKVKIVIFVCALVVFYVMPVSAEVFVAADGTYVGGLASLSPQGPYIDGTPSITKDGFYTDGLSKKEKFKDRHKEQKTSEDPQK